MGENKLIMNFKRMLEWGSHGFRSRDQIAFKYRGCRFPICAIVRQNLAVFSHGLFFPVLCSWNFSRLSFVFTAPR